MRKMQDSFTNEQRNDAILVPCVSHDSGADEQC
ncbi:hypothetical protein BJB45_16370 [Halomonas huangheensis]|uniref:Uncharacterized protein n=1 Tax=Halomonas huangheensis TaxID=1178482 RepID=W1NBL0_9GAMM|nr:hypothetical protein BJB45_16370 [Halomonas huangheensis]